MVFFFFFADRGVWSFFFSFFTVGANVFNTKVSYTNRLYRMLGWIWHCTVLENLVLRLGQEIVRISNQTNANSREEAYLGR